MIRAPFNFVPLSEKVFFPDWAGEISQDIPFEDGVSGTIDLTITAESPIFIRNGHTKKDHEEQTDEYKSFSHVTGPDGKPLYFIPATSIKGEVRTLLEIMSYSKMTVDKRAQFARRDLTPGADYPLKGASNGIRCGWLQRNERNNYEIIDCGIPYRISQENIDAYLNEKCHCGEILTDKFKQGKDFDPKAKVSIEVDGTNVTVEKGSVTYKKHLLKEYEENLKNLCFALSRQQPVEPYILKNRVEIKDTGSIRGLVVVTGQPNSWSLPRGKKAGKYYEFVFKEPNGSSAPLSLSDDMFAHHRFIYEDSIEFKRFLHNKVDRLPVFFRIERGRIKDFGLAYLYKLPYEYSVYDSLSIKHKEHQDQRPDLAQCMFGYTEDETGNKKQGALKGRVQFGNAKATTVVSNVDREVRLILGSPKASYYPIYVEQQEDQEGYSTYDKSNPKGWKRYHVRGDVWRKEAETNRQGVDTQNTVIRPLGVGTQFKGSVSFHNLKPIELGALLAALTFFNNSNECCHQLGQAKPYGYGKCTFNIDRVRTMSYDANANYVEKTSVGEEACATAIAYMKLFEKSMNTFLGPGKKWVDQVQIKQLMTNASRPVNGYRFEYMELEQYKQAKESRESLPLATSRGLQVFEPESILRNSVADSSKPLPIPGDPSFGDWLKALKEWGESHKEELTGEQKAFAYSQLKEAYQKSIANQGKMKDWEVGGNNCKRSSKLEIIGKALANEWFEILHSSLK